MGAVSAKPSAMELVRNLLKRVAREKRPIVLVGEPGVGKRFFAKTLHRLSGRGGRFEVLDCRNADLGEAAMQMIRSAGGTFLIEEILELPRAWRASLLAMLRDANVSEDQAVSRRPSPRIVFTAPIPADGLPALVGGLVLRIPPLRERAEEIPGIIGDLIHDLCGALARAPCPRIAPAAMDELMRHEWPGNVGELSDVLHRVLRLCAEEEIAPEHLPFSLQLSAARRGLVRSREIPFCSLCGVPGRLTALITGARTAICNDCVQDAQQMLSAAVDSPPDATEQSNLCCSFCEKGAAETRHLIGVVPPPLLKAWQGDVAICDACLDICDDIIAQGLTGQEDAQPTITFRAAHPPERVESALAEADALLARHKACNVVVFLDGAAERAAAVLEQTKRALRARAELWERQSAQPPAAVLFALPPPDPSWEDR